MPVFILGGIDLKPLSATIQSLIQLVQFNPSYDKQKTHPSSRLSFRVADLYSNRESDTKSTR